MLARGFAYRGSRCEGILLVSEWLVHCVRHFEGGRHWRAIS